MKKLTTLLFATLTASFTTGRIHAADPESAFGLAPSAAPQLAVPAAPAAPAATATPATPTTPSTDKPSTDSPAVPEEVAPAKTFTRDDAKAQYQGMDRTAVADEKLRKLIELRVATAKAERDPNLQAIKARALVARTDFEQRKLYTEYYTQLYSLIEKIDPKLNNAEIEMKKSLYILRFTQSRVSPTIDPAIARAGHN